MDNELMSSFSLELRRGTIILCVLSQVKEAKYGYALVHSLEEKGMPIDPNTLYPLLRRLEKQGILISEWDLTEAKPRKYYKRTELGDDIFKELTAQWRTMNRTIETLLSEE